MEWRRQASCQIHDSDLFMPGSPDVVKAKSICFWCPVQVECLNHAMTINADGIWGGLTQEEREYLKKPITLSSGIAIIWEEIDAGPRPDRNG